MIEEGDVVFTKTASVGKCALIKNLPCKATINPQLVVLKIFKSIHRISTIFFKILVFNLKLRNLLELALSQTSPNRPFQKSRFPFHPLRYRRKL